jgi:hypothetical protein
MLEQRFRSLLVKVGLKTMLGTLLSSPFSVVYQDHAFNFILCSAKHNVQNSF